MLEAKDEIEGVAALVKWFGQWPSFHDAEILSLELNRDQASRLRIRTFDKTDQIDSQGFYILRKHVIVTFWLEGIADLHLDGFSSQNVIAGLSFRQTDPGYEITLEDCHGLSGRLLAAKAKLEWEELGGT